MGVNWVHRCLGLRFLRDDPESRWANLCRPAPEPVVLGIRRRWSEVPPVVREMATVRLGRVVTVLKQQCNAGLF